MKKIKIVYLFIATLVLSSCKHDHLYYATGAVAEVQVNVDWAPSVLTPNGVSAVAFNCDGGEIHTQFPMHRVGEPLYLSLPVGEYDILIFNNSESEYSAVEFGGFENISSALAVAKVKDPIRVPSKTDEDREVVMDPEVIASTLLRNVKVTEANIEVYEERPESIKPAEKIILDATPVRRVQTFVLQAKVFGINFAAGAPRTFFKHLATGYYLGLEEVDERQIMHEFLFNNRELEPGSTSIGTITQEFTSFGLLSDAATEYVVDIDFTLLDGKKYPVIETFTKDNITTKIEDGIEKHFIYLEVYLPEAVGGTDGSFDVEAEEWKDEEIALPM